MKRQIRILGIDDSPFTFTEKYATIIGVVMRGGEYLECVLRNQITVDGDDATQICIEMIKHTKHRKQLKVAMVDGITFGGFNILDIHHLYTSTKLPIITITRDKPDFKKIRDALKKHFVDWEKRWTIIKSEKIYEITTTYNPIYVSCVGLPIDEAKEIIKLSTIRGVIPEPLRVAHIIASGITRGESNGKA
jgi:uncharacterized protein